MIHSLDVLSCEIFLEFHDNVSPIYAMFDKVSLVECVRAEGETRGAHFRSSCLMEFEIPPVSQ